MFPLFYKDAPADTYVRLAAGHYDTEGALAFDVDTYISSSVMSVKPEDLLATLGVSDNVFFSPAVYKDKTGHKSSVAGSRMLWCDIDESPPPLCAFPPTVIVSSGHGFHYYWALSSWLTSTEILEKLNHVIEDDLYHGGGTWNCNRIMRVPASTNAKPNTKPVKCIVVAVRPAFVYEIGDFDVYARLHANVRRRMATGSSQGYRSRSERDFAIFKALLLAGADEPVIERLATYGAWGDVVREEGLSYFKKTLASAQQSADKAPNEKPTGQIEEHEDGYYLVLSNGGRRRITTFVFEPKQLLEHPDGDAIIGDVRAAETTHVWRDITFSRRAFNGHGAMSRELPLAAWQILGGDAEVKLLLPYIMHQLFEKGMPKRKATSVLGLHDDLFVGTSCAIGKDKVYDRTESPIVYLASGREHPAFGATPLPKGTGSILSRLGTLNNPTTIYPVLGWWACAFARTLLSAIGVRVPTLNCYGTRGSGKTTTIHLFQRLFGTATPVSYDCNTTRFVSLSLLGSTNCVPVSFSEYRSSHSTGFLRFVLLAYDAGQDARGRADQTTVTYPLTAPIVLDGEDMVADAAARERIIAVPFHPEALTEERKIALQSLPQDEIDGFAVWYLQLLLGLAPQVPAMWQWAYNWTLEKFPQPLPQRIRNNVACVALGLRLLDIMPQVEWFDECIGSVYDAKKQRTVALVDDFVEAVTNNANTGEFYSRRDHDLLYFHFATAYAWWLKEVRRQGERPLAIDALKVQLQERQGTGPGQYMEPGAEVDGRRVYCVNLVKAYESGLDIRHTNNSKPVEPEQMEVTLIWATQ